MKKLTIYGLSGSLVNFVKNQIEIKNNSASSILKLAKESGHFDNEDFGWTDISDLIYHLPTEA